MTLTLASTGADGEDLIFSQLDEVVTLASKRATPLNHVLLILRLRSPDDVLGIPAARIVAGVTVDRTFTGNTPETSSDGGYLGHNLVPGHPHLRIALPIVSLELPVPAPVRHHLPLFKKSSLGSDHGVYCSAVMILSRSSSR